MILNPFILGFVLIAIGISGCTPTASITNESEDHKEQPLFKNVSDEDRIFSGLHGTPCKPKDEKISKADCLAGYLCVQNPLATDTGICLMDCGANEDGILKKRPEVCPSDRQCMLMKDEYLSPIGMFCLTPQKSRDLPCAAPFDENACRADLTCLPTKKGFHNNKTIFGSYRCKMECSLTSSCNNEEECLTTPYSRTERQPTKDKSTMPLCDLAKCRNGDESCACNKNLGYFCTEIMAGLEMGLCQRSLGICGQPILPAKLTDFKGKAFLGETCNDIDDNRICRSPVSENALSKTLSQCITPSHSSTEGICIDLCSVPSLDENLDGTLSDSELGISVNCPTGYSCKTNIARTLNKYKITAISCDPKQCKENTPCPEQCGAGVGECLEVLTKDGVAFFCGAPFGTCVLD